jgi:hypothetical protein
MAKEQIRAAKLANKAAEMKLYSRPTIAWKSSRDPAGMPAQKYFLDEVSGVISGVDPETVFKENAANTRAGMEMLSRAGGGGGGEEKNPALNPALFTKNESKDAQMTRSNLAATAEENKQKQNVADQMAMDKARYDAERDRQNSINDTRLKIETEKARIEADLAREKLKRDAEKNANKPPTAAKANLDEKKYVSDTAEADEYFYSQEWSDKIKSNYRGWKRKWYEDHKDDPNGVDWDMFFNNLANENAKAQSKK